MNKFITQETVFFVESSTGGSPVSFVHRRAACATLLLWLFSVGLSTSLFGTDILRLDAGPDGLPPAPGWERLGAKQIYQPGQNKMGWEKVWGYGYGDSKSGNVTESAIGASQPGTEGTLIVEIPNGAYYVTVQVGCPVSTEGRTAQCVEINGKPVLPPPGVGAWGKMVKRLLSAVVDDGKMRIRFFTAGNEPTHRLNLLALEIAPASDQTEEGQIRAEWKKVAFLKTGERPTVMLGGKEREIVNIIAPGDLTKTTAAADATGYCFFVKPDSGEILANTIPDDAEVIKQISAFAAPGEEQPFILGVHALRTLGGVSVNVTDFKDASGNILKSDCFDLRTVTSLYRTTTDRPNYARLTGELLERDFPFDLTAGKTQGLYILARIPESQRPGLYRGNLQVQPQSGGKPGNIVMNLRILPIKFASPKEERDWMLCLDSPWAEMNDVAVEKEIQDLSRHGITGLMIGTPPVYSGALVETPQGEITGIRWDKNWEKHLRYAVKNGIERTLALGSTPFLMWQLNAWGLEAKGNAKAEIREESGRKYFHLKHPDSSSGSRLSMSGFYAIPAGRDMVLLVDYTKTGGGKARFNMSFNDYRRIKTQEPLVLDIPVTDSQTGHAEIRFKTVGKTSQYVADFSFAAGTPGEFILDSIRLFPADEPDMNYMVNPYWVRRMNNEFNADKEWPEDFIKNYQQYVVALRKAAASFGFRELYLVGTDEAGGSKAREYREIHELKYSKSAGMKTFCNLSIPLALKIPELVDAPCFYADLFGSEANELAAVKKFRDLGKKVYHVTAGTYAGQNFHMSTNRYNVGYYYWKSSVQGTWIWTYQRWGGSPYDDFDGDVKDYCLVYPPRQPGGEPIPSIAWEGVREGRRDFNYVNTLEQEIAATALRNPAMAECGQYTLDFIRNAIPWYDSFDPKRNNDFFLNDLRYLAAWSITEMQETSASSKSPSLPDKIEWSIKTSGRQKDIASAPAVQLVPGSAKQDDFSLDGKLNDKFWEGSLKLCEFRNYLNPEIIATDKTEVYMRQDSDNLYIGWRCYGDMKKLKSEIRNDENTIYVDDSIEFFFNPGNPESGPYYQFCMNASGSRGELECIGGRVNSIFAVNYGEHKRDLKWKCEWQGKTSIHADRWEAEIILPIAQLKPKGDMWSFLAGRNNRSRGETVSVPSIGMFDQPEKYLPLALSMRHDGNGAIQKWPLTSCRSGIYKSTLSKLGSDGTVAISVKGKDGILRNSKAQIIDGQTEINYELQTGDSLWEMTVADAKSAVQLNYQLTVKVPEILKMSAKKQIFFHDKTITALSLDMALDIALDQGSRKGTQLEFILRSGKSIVHREDLDSTADSLDLHLPLSGFGSGFYTIEARLLKNGKELAKTSLPIIIVPNYASAE